MNKQNSCIYGNTPLHLACIAGELSEICKLLDENKPLSLYLENSLGLTPLFCLIDPVVRKTLLDRYTFVADAYANQVIIIIRSIVSQETDKYTEYKKYGFYRAKQFNNDLEVSMDPFNREKSIKVLEEMIVRMIKHFERLEGFYGLRHKGNLYPHSQDTLLIHSFYLSPVLRAVFGLDQIDYQSLHLSEYHESLREKLLIQLKEFGQLLWSLMLPEIIDDVILI
jgi:hypothetical protein